jgi:hypothetical protein
LGHDVFLAGGTRPPQWGSGRRMRRQKGRPKALAVAPLREGGNLANASRPDPGVGRLLTRQRTLDEGEMGRGGPEVKDMICRHRPCARHMQSKFIGNGQAGAMSDRSRPCPTFRN